MEEGGEEEDGKGPWFVGVFGFEVMVSFGRKERPWNMCLYRF